MGWSRQEREFCAAYLKTMDPERAAAACGCKDGYAMLSREPVRQRLEMMRNAAEGPRREDAVRRLAQLAFGQANDAVRLALDPKGADPGGLDLSAVAELKVTDKGGVEVKLVDRVRALGALCELLGDGGSAGAESLYQALAEAAGQLEERYGE